MHEVPESIVLAQEMYKAKEDLRRAKYKLLRRGREYTRAEKAYRIALRQKIIEYKSKGYPATLISDVARGEVADLKFKRDSAYEIYRGARDFLSYTETEISVLQSINKRHDNI